MKRREISPQEWRSILSYDPETGRLFNGERRGMSLDQRIEMLERELDALKTLQHCDAS